MKKTLGQKLAAHRFTVVSQGCKNDPDVVEFKRREAQAKKRAASRLAAQAKIKDVALGEITIKIDGSRRQGAIANAIITAKKL
jgi:hypothetical protein